PVIDKKDLLSNLPDDCISSIFKYFNHDNLDVVSEVSQRMVTFALIQRPKAQKKTAERLNLFESCYGDICLSL
ncbi:hypothetical protein PMAYCL1PPCAC_22353, partial [Pristionchus mayeri]